MDHVRSATRWVSIAVMINMLVVLVGLLTGGSLLVKLVGIEGPAAQLGEALTTVASMLVMALLALLGLGPSMICNFVGGCSLCQAGAPDETRRWSVMSLLLFSGGFLLIVIVGLFPAEDFPGLRKMLRIIALVMAMGSHGIFLVALRRIASDRLGLEMEPLFWSTLGLGAVTSLLVLLAWLGWFPVFSALGLFALCGLYLAWNGCYLAMLWQIASRS